MQEKFPSSISPTTFSEFKEQFPQKPIKPVKPVKPGILKRVCNVGKILSNSIEDSLETYRKESDNTAHLIEETSDTRGKQSIETRTKGQILNDTAFAISHTMQNTKYKIERLQYLQAKEQYKLDKKLYKLQQRGQRIDRDNFCINGKNQLFVRHSQFEFNHSMSSTALEDAYRSQRETNEPERTSEKIYFGEGEKAQMNEIAYHDEHYQKMRANKDNVYNHEKDKSDIFTQNNKLKEPKIASPNDPFNDAQMEAAPPYRSENDQWDYSSRDHLARNVRKARFVSSGNPLYTVDINGYLYRESDKQADT